MAAHTPEQIAKEERRYLQVFAWLAILTAVEIGVIYAPIARIAIGSMLVLLAATKAALVAMFYMHLRYDSRIFSSLFVGGVLMGAAMVISLILLLAHPA